MYPPLAPWRAVVRILTITTLLLVCIATAASAQATTPPLDWSDQDVNGGSGGWSYGDNGFVVTGTGTDIWGTTDTFHFTYQQVDGDADFRARIAGVSGAEAWTKVGLMIRQRPDDPSAAHHFLLASKGKGLAYQRRMTAGGTSLHTTLNGGGAPVWYRIRRSGGQVELSMSSDGVNWAVITTVAWPTGPTYVGFAVASHDMSTVASGSFEHVALTGVGRTAPVVSVVRPAGGDILPAGEPYTIDWQATDAENDIVRFDVYGAAASGASLFFEPIPGCTGVAGTVRQCTWQDPDPPGSMRVLVVATDRFNDEGRAMSDAFDIGSASGGLPAGWSSDDVGSVSAAGNASVSGGTYTVSGSGADIWDTADEFQFLHQVVSGDFIITARVASVEAVAQWTKAGLMIRETLAAGSRHVSLFATPTSTKGVAFQRRLTTDGFSASTAGPSVAPPVWLKLARTGDGINAYFRRSITDPWQFLAREVVSGLASAVDVGLAVSSHVDGTLATARFTDVTIEPMQPWQTAAIASSQGEASTDGVIFGLYGQGSDIWGTADSMYYTYIPWSGDGTITTRVRDIDPSDAWAKAGVMFRESLTPGSAHAFALLSYSKGAALQYRATTSGDSASAASASGVAPGWLRLTRQGDSFTAQLSYDGSSWQPLGSVTVPMPQSIFVGIAHTTHDPADHLGARFDDLSVAK